MGGSGRGDSTEDDGLARSQERRHPPWAPSFRRSQARRPFPGDFKIIVISIKCQCLFFSLRDLLDSLVKNATYLHTISLDKMGEAETRDSDNRPLF